MQQRLAAILAGLQTAEALSPADGVIAPFREAVSGLWKVLGAFNRAKHHGEGSPEAPVSEHLEQTAGVDSEGVDEGGGAAVAEPAAAACPKAGKVETFGKDTNGIDEVPSHTGKRCTQNGHNTKSVHLDEIIVQATHQSDLQKAKGAEWQNHERTDHGEIINEPWDEMEETIVEPHQPDLQTAVDTEGQSQERTCPEETSKVPWNEMGWKIIVQEPHSSGPSGGHGCGGTKP